MMSSEIESDDYLLDNNIISTLVRGRNDPDWASKDPSYNKIFGKFSKIGNGHIFLPLFAIAEIKFGLALIDPSTLKPKAISERKSLEDFFDRYESRGFDANSIEPYTLIRTRLWKKHAKQKDNGRGYKDTLPEHLFDNQAGDHLGIDEKDLLIFSCAIQYNLKFFTCDGRIGMRRIIEAAKELKDEGKLYDVRLVDDWDN